jgi:glycosyltransferase involved in cell wall biosynthesis
MLLSIIIPCLNEAQTIAICIKKALTFISSSHLEGEIVIADNGSEDGSQQIAIEMGATVVNIASKGYGNALIGGINAANGKYIIMGDADDSYDFSALKPFVEKLEEGYDLVMGNRFKGGIKKGAMPFLHRYLGNPVLSFIGRLFFNSNIGDFHCGLRAISKAAANKMDLQSSGMEFASEMVVKAALLEMKIAEVPTILYPDGRNRPPHLNTWRDGWRHLRFLLMFSPKWLFLYPSMLIMLIGGITSLRLFWGAWDIWGVELDVHTMIYTFSMVLIGFQGVSFFVFSKIYSIQQKLLPKSNSITHLMKYFSLESGIIGGMILIGIGLAFSFYSLSEWNSTSFGSINNQDVLRWVIAGSSSLVLGFQIILYSFFFSILGLSAK